MPISALLCTVLLLLGLIGIYLLHPFISIAFLVAQIAVYLKLSQFVPKNAVQKSIFLSFAFCTFLLILSVPSGELGYIPCPNAIENPDSTPKVMFFHSPFCLYCPQVRENINAAQAIAGLFRVEEYDFRYCRNAASAFKFTGTPCLAFVGKGGIAKECGSLSAEEIAKQVKSVS